MCISKSVHGVVYTCAVNVIQVARNHRNGAGKHYHHELKLITPFNEGNVVISILKKLPH